MIAFGSLTQTQGGRVAGVAVLARRGRAGRRGEVDRGEFGDRQLRDDGGDRRRRAGRRAGHSRRLVRHGSVTKSV